MTGKIPIIRSRKNKYLCFFEQHGIADVGQAGDNTIHEGCNRLADGYQKKGEHQKNQKHDHGLDSLTELSISLPNSHYVDCSSTVDGQSTPYNPVNWKLLDKANSGNKFGLLPAAMTRFTIKVCMVRKKGSRNKVTFKLLGAMVLASRAVFRFSGKLTMHWQAY